MAATYTGPISWKASRDSYGHRTYNLQSGVRTDDVADGPQVVMACSGLHEIGSVYNFRNDVDDWAYCWPDMNITMLDSNKDNTKTWLVEQKFSTLPMVRCGNFTVQDPLSEPQKIGGSFVRYTKAATRDRYGLAILSSSWELLKGREVEFDEAYPTVWIEQNVAVLGLEDFSRYVNGVNDDILWGMNARCVKLSNVTWQRNFSGICSNYYTRRFEFDINYNTFDRYAQDEGTKVLNGHLGTPGTGCTINVTGVGATYGEITSATIASGGTGYGTSRTLTLAVQGGSGEGASITVETNGSGVVTSVVVVSNGGTGYSTSDSGLSTIGSGWILDNINGQAPNPDNPQHFIRYKDMRGECSRVILDGQGQPAINKYPGQRLIEKYEEFNMLLLGIPVSL